MTVSSRIELPELLNGSDPSHLVQVFRQWKESLQSHMDVLDRSVPIGGQYESSSALAAKRRVMGRPPGRCGRSRSARR